MSSPTSAVRLHTYWRSSAAYRVRIALALKGIAYESVCWHMANGEHLQPSYREIAPFGLVPVLEIDGLRLQQSLAILEYLEERQPAPSLLPADRAQRAHARALAQLVACEIHPLNNLRVLKRLRGALQADEAQVHDWYRHWCDEGFRAFEAALPPEGDGPFALGAQPSIVECCLIPQIYNARRFDVQMDRYPRIARIAQACAALPAFEAARPERQPDAPAPVAA
ncbi:maleylacetoacetate isomerase [Acidovorax cavernicola]|uniref:Maleylacetoacetate isomerase n=1 Tax=Acidovorax cavernicola TaxID=1675792 RepID=A0A9X8D9H1_9BURK|nr:maleylacetoacetate isomerase [Acidovorax cavernicola]RIX85312.1 maleylacetoacetate isomerase [Acidovorax cavernicola]